MEDPFARPVNGVPVSRLPGCGPWHANWKADEIHAHLGRHFDLGLEQTGRPSQESEGIAGTIERHRQVARWLRPRPELNAIMVPANKCKIRRVIDVPVGPLPVGGLVEVHMEGGGAICAR